MQEPLPAYSENHHKLARAVAPLAGSEQSYSRADLVRQVRRMFPELSKNDVKPQKHCLNYSISSACACSRSADALFEKLDTADGSHRYRVLSSAANPSQSRKTDSLRPQPAASAFARAPVTPRRQSAPIASQAAPAASLSLDLGGLLPRLKQWLFGEKPSARQKPLRAASSLSVSKMSLPPLPPLPPLPVVTAPLPAVVPPGPLVEMTTASEVKDQIIAVPETLPVSEPMALPVSEQAFSVPEPALSVSEPVAELVIDPVIEPVAETAVPALPILQVLRLPAPAGVQRLMIQSLSLDAEQKLHLKLSPEMAEASLELVYLHFRDSVVKELAVVGSEPLEVGFRLLGQPGLSRILIQGLCDGVWQGLQTSEQSFPVLPEPVLVTPAEAFPMPVLPQAAEAPAKPVAQEAPEAPPVRAPVVTEIQVPAEQVPPQVKPEPAPGPDIMVEHVDPYAWLDEVPELYRPLMQHIQTHGSLGEAAMIGMLGGGNAGARKARGFAVQVDQWQGMPFEIEIVQTPEGKTYQKV